MPATLIGRKIGMTRLYDELGNNIPVTVLGAGVCSVSQVKTTENDGYEAVQLAFEDVKARNSTMPVIGHDASAGLGPKRVHREFRVSDEEAGGFELGQDVTVDTFEGIMFVDVIGTSKGKGFAGTMKRWGFKGQPASHGVERKHRSPGSICSHASNRGFSGRPKKGLKMSGRMGNARITSRSLEVVGRDTEKGLLMVKGTVPGANGGLLMIREARRLSKSKAKKAKAS
jgi:large subunit ribosomal protein L3